MPRGLWVCRQPFSSAVPDDDRLSVRSFPLLRETFRERERSRSFGFPCRERLCSIAHAKHCSWQRSVNLTCSCRVGERSLVATLPLRSTDFENEKAAREQACPFSFRTQDGPQCP